MYYMMMRALKMQREEQNVYTRDSDMSLEFGWIWYSWKLARCYATFDTCASQMCWHNQNWRFPIHFALLSSSTNLLHQFVFWFRNAMRQWKEDSLNLAAFLDTWAEELQPGVSNVPRSKYNAYSVITLLSYPRACSSWPRFLKMAM